MIKGEMFAVLRMEVEKLPADCRRVFKMLYYEGKKPAEVAAILNISVNTVAAHRYNALKFLRKNSLTDRLLLGFLVLRWLEVLLKKLF
jgi:RNA polymerase sigma-70 factor (ECF subfamily)